MLKPKKILVLNGPNLNLLGQRETEIYGTETLDEIQEFVRSRLKRPYPKWEWFQSNSEADLIEKIHAATHESWSGLVFNPGALAHTSIALLDALKAYSGFKIEVHLSNTHAREEFRRIKLTACGVDGVIEGLGKNSYLYAIKEIVET